VFPARKRLYPDDLLAAVVDDRLVGKIEPDAILDGVAQIGFQPARQVFVHRRVVNARALAAFVFRPVERNVGVAHDIGSGFRALIDHRDADAGAEYDILTVDGIGRGDAGDDASARHHAEVGSLPASRLGQAADVELTHGRQTQCSPILATWTTGKPSGKRLQMTCATRRKIEFRRFVVMPQTSG